MGEEGGSAEVVDLEDGGAGLGGAALEFGRVDLEEVEIVEVSAEGFGHGGAEAEDGVVCASLLQNVRFKQEMLRAKDIHTRRSSKR